MIKLKNAQGILSTEVPTGNLLWVDQVNGNDTLAIRGRMTIPFRTLTAAKAAAKFGDTIMVLPGIYDEAGLAKHGVNWSLLAGVTIASTANVSVFDDGETEMSYDVDGFGVISSSGSASEVFLISHADSRVRIRCRELTGLLSLGHSLMRVQAGDVEVECQRMELSSLGAGYGRALSVSGGKLVALVQEIISVNEEALSQNGGTVYLTLQRLYSDINKGVRCSGGVCHVVASTIEAPSNIALEITGGTVQCTAQRISVDGSFPAVIVNGTVTEAHCTIRAQLIEAPYSVVYTNNGDCRVFGARIVGDFPVNANGTVVAPALNNCWLVGPTYSIGTDSEGSVVCRACAGNVGIGPDITLLPSEDELLIDASYT